MESSTAALDFVLNGRTNSPSVPAPQTTLLDYIRSCGLTGSKEGCAEGECGACAVLLVQSGTHGASYRAVNSCLIPLLAVAGQEIYTIEALAEAGRLADVQRTMVDHGGSQCGYCTPGFVVSMFAAHMAGHVKEMPFDPEALGGNLCRCTGYRPIRDAFQSLGPAPDTPLRRRLNSPAPPLLPVDCETPQGRFSRPCNLGDALRLAVSHSTAQFVAGNTDLGVLTNLRSQRFRHLISLEGIPELREFADLPDRIQIGAGLTLTEIEECWTNAPDVFRAWLRLFASPLIRNRATLGGNLSTASPIGDAAPLLLALDAELHIAGIAGERIVPLHGFFRAYRETALAHGEIIRSIRIPKPLPDRIAFYKVAKRRVDDISTVAAAFATRANRTRLAFGGVGPIPLRAIEAEDDLDHYKEILARTLRPMSDHRGSTAYRLAMAKNLVEKFLLDFPTTQGVSAGTSSLNGL
jgi:xanthine dehydrogenase small subunit